MTNKTPAIDPLPRVKRRVPNLTVPLATLCLASVPFTVARAADADGTWINNGNGNWTDAANWAGTPSGIVAQGADFTADFSTIDITVSRTVTLTEALTIGNLKFGDITAEGTPTATRKNWTLSGSTLTLDTTTGTASTITVDNGTTTISSMLVLSDDSLIKAGSGALTLSGNNSFTGTLTTLTTSGGALTLSGSNNFSGSLTKAGSGTMTLSGNNSFAGTLTTTGGTLVLTGNNTGITTTTISAGTLRIGSDGGTGSVTGDIVNNGALQVQRNNAITLDGNISGTGSLTKLNSTGVLTLTGNNTYSGGTTVSDGAILLGAGTNNGIGTGTLTLNQGRFGSADDNARTITNTLSLAVSGGLTLGAAEGATTGRGDLTFTSTAAAAPGNNTISVNNATTVTLNNQFTGGQIIKGGTGTLVLNNANSSYTGVTKVNGGILSVDKVANGGSNSSIGAAAATADKLVLGGGTLKFTGASSGSTNRLFTLAYGANDSTSALDASGDVPLQFTGTGDIGVENNTATTPWSSTDVPAGTTQFTMSDVSRIAVGMGVTGTNIAAGTYVTAVDTATKKITLSAGTTALITTDGSRTFTLYGGPRTLTLTGTNTGANTLAANLTDAPESNGSQSSLLSHAASLVKDGTGTWIITGNHSYTGTTKVNAGTLLVNNDPLSETGAGTGMGAVTVAFGATLGGSGSIGGATTIAGTLSVGGGADTTLAFNSSLTLQGTALTLLDIASASMYDSISIAGAFIYGGGIEISLLNEFTLDANQSYDLFSFGGTISGTLNSVSVAATALQETAVGSGVWTGTDGSLTYTFTNSTGVLEVAASAIPEPSTYAAIAGALVLGAVLVRRRRRAQAQA